ncbi:MAG: response regulator [Burkholderiales bacterium]|nr:response regulator [Anaerolineae bacterium]
MSEYPSVLYVEDDPKSREIMQLLLVRAMGLSNVAIFDDSENFLSRVQALDPLPDIVLLDIHVHPHNGYEMLQMLRGLESLEAVPIIALTASVMNEEIAELRTSGFHSVISKPINQDVFPDILRRILRGESIWRVSY